LLRDQDETRDASIRDQDVEDFVRDETETLVRLETVSRLRRLDRDHIPEFNLHRKFNHYETQDTKK